MSIKFCLFHKILLMTLGLYWGYKMKVYFAYLYNIHNVLDTKIFCMSFIFVNELKIIVEMLLIIN